jgi:hypothetical protein
LVNPISQSHLGGASDNSLAGLWMSMPPPSGSPEVTVSGLAEGPLLYRGSSQSHLDHRMAGSLGELLG